LCQRFPKCTTMAQSADLAYCIGQLKLTEKSIKCLSDHFHLYKNALADEQVLKFFTNIVTKAKKFMKPERKQLMEEWEAKLSEFAAMGVENQRADEKAAQSSKRRKNHKRRVPKSAAFEEVIEEDLDFPEEEVDEDEGKPEANDLVDSDEENLGPRVPKPSRRKVQSKKGVVQSSSEVNKENRSRSRRAKAIS
jgi:condensin complex subunit 1